MVSSLLVIVAFLLVTWALRPEEDGIENRR